MNKRSATHPRRRLALPALTCGLLLLGLLLRLPALAYDGALEPGASVEMSRSPQERFNDFAFARFAYSDILSLYYRDGLQHQPVPYSEYRIEYPVGIAGFSYLLSFAGGPRAYYLLSYLLLSLCTLATVWLLMGEPGTRPWVFAAAPAIAVHVGVNWDVLAILPSLAALLLAQRRRLLWAGLLLALATWTKVFPLFFLVPLLAVLALERRWRDAALLLGSFAAVSLVMNLPAMLANLERWAYFLTVQFERRREVNIWTLLPQIGHEELGGWLLALTAAGALVACVPLLRQAPGARMERAPAAGSALLLWVFFIGKIYSPQYGLWVVALLALLAAPAWMAIAFWAVDLVYYLYSFITLALLPYQEAVGWFYSYQLLPAMVIREALLLLLAGWALWRAWQPGRQEVGYAGAT